MPGTSLTNFAGLSNSEMTNEFISCLAEGCLKKGAATPMPAPGFANFYETIRRTRGIPSSKTSLIALGSRRDTLGQLVRSIVGVDVLPEGEVAIAIRIKVKFGTTGKHPRYSIVDFSVPANGSQPLCNAAKGSQPLRNAASTDIRPAITCFCKKLVTYITDRVLEICYEGPHYPSVTNTSPLELLILPSVPPPSNTKDNARIRSMYEATVTSACANGQVILHAMHKTGGHVANHWANDLFKNLVAASKRPVGIVAGTNGMIGVTVLWNPSTEKLDAAQSQIAELQKQVAAAVQTQKQAVAAADKRRTDAVKTAEDAARSKIGELEKQVATLIASATSQAHATAVQAQAAAAADKRREDAITTAEAKITDLQQHVAKLKQDVATVQGRADGASAAVESQLRRTEEAQHLLRLENIELREELESQRRAAKKSQEAVEAAQQEMATMYEEMRSGRKF